MNKRICRGLWGQKPVPVGYKRCSVQHLAGKMTLRVQPKWSEKIVKIVTDDLPEVPEAVMAPVVPSESSSSKRKSRRSNNSKFRLKGHGEPVSALVKTLEYVFALPNFCSEPCVTIHFHVEGDEGPILRWPILRSREGEEILAEGYCRIYLFPMIFSAQPIVGTVLTRPSPRAIRILKDMLIELATETSVMDVSAGNHGTNARPRHDDSDAPPSALPPSEPR